MMNPMNQIGGRGWDQNYYDNNYQRNECMFGCPANSHCEWGFCECNAGTSRFFRTQLFIDPVIDAMYHSGGSVNASLIGARSPTMPLDLRPLIHSR